MPDDLLRKPRKSFSLPQTFPPRLPKSRLPVFPYHVTLIISSSRRCGSQLGSVSSLLRTVPNYGPSFPSLPCSGRAFSVQFRNRHEILPNMGFRRPSPSPPFFWLLRRTRLFPEPLLPAAVQTGWFFSFPPFARRTHFSLSATEGVLAFPREQPAVQGVPFFLARLSAARTTSRAVRILVSNAAAPALRPLVVMTISLPIRIIWRRPSFPFSCLQELKLPSRVARGATPLSVASLEELKGASLLFLINGLIPP